MPDRQAMLELFRNLAEHHREHEKYYSESPLHDAVTLQRWSRTLKALAERWTRVPATDSHLPNPYAGARDLNDPRAIETSGVLFMESGEPPAEIARLKGELATMAESAEQTGTWLVAAMQATWATAERLLDFPELADLLGERHSIIASTWQNASMLVIQAHQLRRAIAILDRVDFATPALRADLAGDRLAPRYLFSAAELIDAVADNAARGAAVVHGNERKWRVFRERLDELSRAANA
jgi:hypothetical protein